VKPNIAHAFPAVVDISRGSPAIAAHSRPPGPHVAHPILAITKDDIPRNTIEGGAHHDIRLLQSVETRFETGKIAVRTKVIFQIVDTPVTIGPRILQLMLPASEIATAGSGAGGRVDTELQSKTVYIVGRRLEIGEFVVGVDLPVGTAIRRFPAIVDIDIGPSVCAKLIRHLSGRDPHLLVIHAESPGIPAVPAQHRCQPDQGAYADSKSPRGAAKLIGHGKLHVIVAGLIGLSGDDAGRSVQRKTSRKTGGFIGQGTHTRRRYLIKKRPAGACAIDCR